MKRARLTFFVLPAVLAVAAEAQTSRTPWGDPDLQGKWSNATLTPLQRPAELGDKQFFTEDEAKAYVRQRINNLMNTGLSTGLLNLPEETCIPSVDLLRDVTAKALVIGCIGDELHPSAIATRLALNELRRRAWVVQPVDTVIDDFADARDPTKQSQIVGRGVAAAIESLSPPLRAAFLLREIHGLDYAEIAEVLEIDLGTVKSRLNRARSRLREAIGDPDAVAAPIQHDREET